MTLREFYAACRSADWNFRYSDNGDIFDRGFNETQSLCRQAAESPQHRKIFDAMKIAGESGTAFPSFEALEQKPVCSTYHSRAVGVACTNCGHQKADHNTTEKS